MRSAFALTTPRVLLEAGRTRVLLRPANDNMDDDPPPAASARLPCLPWTIDVQAAVSRRAA